MDNGSLPSISDNFIHDSEIIFKSNPANKIALNAVTNNGIDKVAVVREKIPSYQLQFSTEINTKSITNQKLSGRCWIFAALNSLRITMIKRLNFSEKFELSQSYIMFYDKLEKSNYFLENIIKTLGESNNSRLFMWLLENCIEDGGQWSMFTSLVKKYGLVPRTVYPESISSSNTNLMNIHISEKLREYACIMRAEYQKKESIHEVRQLKKEMLKEVHKILLIHNGIPPKKFIWNYNDKDGKFHRSDREVTPIQFRDNFMDIDLDGYISLIHCPTTDKEFNKHYTVNFLGNVVGGDEVSYINVSIEILKKAVIKTLKEGYAVWFGCDVGKGLLIDKGILDQDVMNFSDVYGIRFEMEKGKSIEFGNSKMTHAMLITGVHEENNRVVRWKIENSWGEKSGRKGFLIMGDNWFDKYVYQVVVPKKNVDSKISMLLENSPKILEPWDPMGSLAY